MKAETVNSAMTPRIYRTIQFSTVMFLIGLVAGIAMKNGIIG